MHEVCLEDQEYTLCGAAKASAPSRGGGADVIHGTVMYPPMGSNGTRRLFDNQRTKNSAAGQQGDHRRNNRNSKTRGR